MQVINGLQLGLLLFMVASGLTLVFGILDFVNLAHASLYMVGAMICASLSFFVGGFVWAVLLALPLTALVGWGIERLVARRLYARGHLDHVLATFGLILVLNTSAHLLWGPEGIPVALPMPNEASVMGVMSMPARPASTAPIENTNVNNNSMLMPKAATICLLEAPARMSIPSLVRVTNQKSPSAASSPAPIITSRYLGSTSVSPNTI